MKWVILALWAFVLVLMIVVVDEEPSVKLGDICICSSMMLAAQYVEAALDKNK